MVGNLSCRPLHDLITILTPTLAVLVYDVCSRNLRLILLVIYPYHRDVIDERMVHQLAFQFCRCYLETFVLDKFLDTIRNVEVVIIVLIADIAGLEETMAVLCCYAVVCCLFVLPIALVHRQPHSSYHILPSPATKECSL